MRAALGFLTVLGGAPTPGPTTLRWFPVAGLGLGTVVGLVWWGAGEWWPPLVAAVLVVGVDLALTGLLHVDGLADTADGLLVHGADRDRRLTIMAAPDVGAYGAAVVALVLLARVAALAAIAPDVVLLAALWGAARSCMAVVAGSVPYAREHGLASAFLGPGATAAGAVGLVAALLLAGIGSTWGAVAGVVAVALVAGTVARVARHRLGGFTGDVLGAAGLLGETAGLLVAAARW